MITTSKMLNRIASQGARPRDHNTLRSKRARLRVHTTLGLEKAWP